MEPNRIDSAAFSKRLSTLYANYSDAWRAAFGMPAASSPATPLEQREQRWENEGGSPRKDA